MKKIFESEWNSWDESAEKIHIFELESDEEFWELENMSYEEKCAYFGVRELMGWAVTPGGTGYSYGFVVKSYHVIMIESATLNV